MNNEEWPSKSNGAFTALPVSDFFEPAGYNFLNAPEQKTGVHQHKYDVAKRYTVFGLLMQTNKPSSRLYNMQV